jgi:hypothetical protein
MSEHTEQFDEDNVGLDPLEEGMDPPEHWSQADRFGNTEREMREGQDLDHRLAEEQPDITEDPPRDRPLGATPDTELDEHIDDETGDEEPFVPEEPHPDHPNSAARNGTSANEAGGSMAEQIRTPPGRPR